MHKEVLSEPVKYSQGREYDSPKIFPDMYEVIEDDCTGDDKKNQEYNILITNRF